MRPSLFQRIRQRARNWARKRQGNDPSPVTLERRRVYILPTRAGVIFGMMLFAMLLGSMNYSNSMGFVLTFFLAGLGLVSMHHCHRNLEGLVLRIGRVEPVFAGQAVTFHVYTENKARAPRCGITLHYQDAPFSRVDVPDGGSALLSFDAVAKVRGRFNPGAFSVSTTYPFGLFRAWAWMYMDLECIVYPRPADEVPEQPPKPSDDGGLMTDETGQDDFSGLRAYRQGDAPKHVAWKASARLTTGLLVKQFHGGGTVERVFDFDDLRHLDTEQRLSMLCRYCLDAEKRGENYALELPGRRLDSGQGGEHLHSCLVALALFDLETAGQRRAA